MLFDRYGYTLVHLTWEGINAFWIRDDVLEKAGRDKFPNAGDIQALRSAGVRTFERPKNTDKEWDRASLLLEDGEGIQKINTEL